MQIQIFKISLEDGEGLEEMNVFLRSHRILEVQQEFVGGQFGGYWSFCIRFVQSSGKKGKWSNAKKGRIDYREVLDEATFKVFSVLRVCRKAIAEASNVPVYAVFTNAELAEMAKLEELTVEKLQKIEGIGTKRAEKYGVVIVEKYHEQLTHEKK